MTSVLQIELNEINFDYVQRYVDRGYLPTLGQLISTYGITETVSEERYEWLEPWIQWVTAHTGMSFEEHGIFRLGDIVERPELRQVWEALESQGKRVAAVSPMNARNSAANSPFFVPDPWTDTAVTGQPLIKDLYAALRQAVNDNASQRLSVSSAIALVKGIFACCRHDEFLDLVKLAAGATMGGWRKAIFLDVLLSAIYLSLWEKHRPDFSTLFLNAGAHIQHHYMFSSAVYDGPHENPDWYLARGKDPLLEIYAAYDRILARVLKRAPEQRIIIATALHQDPEPNPVYYWRPKRHENLLSRLGLKFESVEPRMSRDFLVRFADETASREGEKQLAAVTLRGERVFSIDQRGREIFVELVYPHALEKKSFLESSYGRIDTIDLSEETAFVAVKNGRHNGIGYLIDTANAVASGNRMLLKDMPRLVGAMTVST